MKSRILPSPIILLLISTMQVSSTEAQMKNDGTDFSYDSATTAAVSRVHCRMNPYGPQHQSYNPHITPLGPDTYPSYRHNSISAYQPIKYYGIASFNDFADENVDYGIPTSNYSVLNQEPISIPYTNVGSARWAQHQLPKSNSLFVEQDSPYNHLPSYSTPFPYRPHCNTESKSLSLHSMANALSPSVSGTDRVLPAPAPVHYRTAQVAGSYLRSTENPLPMSQAPVYNNSNGLMSAHMINTVKALSSSSSSESMTSSNYLPLSSSPPESVPSSHMSYGAHSVSSTQNHDNYPTSHESQQMYNQQNNSLDNINYAISQPPSSGSHRSSIPSQNEDSQTTASNGSGALVNGYQYVPPLSDQPSYPQPPLPLRLPEQPAAQSVAQRHSVSAT